MKRFRIALAALLGILLVALLGTASGGSASAEKWPSPLPAQPVSAVRAATYVEGAAELMTVEGASGRKAFVYINYNREVPGTGGGDPRLIQWSSAEFWTDPGFKANRMDVRLETAPGVWKIIWHRGGDKDTWDDVPSSTSVGSLGDHYITNSSDTPKWQFRVWGVCAGTCGDYYEEDFGNVW